MKLANFELFCLETDMKLKQKYLYNYLIENPETELVKCQGT